MSGTDRRRGAVLLECLVALALVVVLGLPALSLSRASLAALAQAALEERQLDRADQVMTRMALLSQRELDLRLGWHRMDAFVVNVQRPERELYRIAVADTVAPELALLVTVVHRYTGGPQ